MRKLQWAVVVGVIFAAVTAILAGLFFGLHAVVRWIGVGLLRHFFHPQSLGKGSEAAWWIISVVLAIVAIVVANALTGRKEVISGGGGGWGAPTLGGGGLYAGGGRPTPAAEVKPSARDKAPEAPAASAPGGGPAVTPPTPQSAAGSGGGGQRFSDQVRSPYRGPRESTPFGSPAGDKESVTLHEPQPKPASAQSAPPPAASAPPQGQRDRQGWRTLHEPTPMPVASAPPAPPASAPAPPPTSEKGEITRIISSLGTKPAEGLPAPPRPAPTEPPAPPPPVSAAPPSEPAPAQEQVDVAEIVTVDRVTAQVPIEHPADVPEPPAPEPSWELKVETPFTVGPPLPPFGPGKEAPAEAEPSPVQPEAEIVAEAIELAAEPSAEEPQPASEAIEPVAAEVWPLDLGPLPTAAAPEPPASATEPTAAEIARRQAKRERAKAPRIHKLDRVGKRAEEDGSGEQASREPAQYVNFKILDATISEERLLGSYEGLYAGLKYRLVVSMAMEADARFAATAGPQPKVERPPVQTVILDVVLSLEENLQILGERWSTLEWPESGPSLKNAEFLLRPGAEGKANLKVLMYYRHDLVFSSAIKFAVGSEGDDWPVEEKPITWTALDQTRTGRLSLFLNFQDLDREAKRGLNISVHRRAPELFDLVFFLRSSGPVARAYPLRVEISEQEIGGYLAKTRSALRLLTKTIEHPESDGYSVERFVDDMSLIGNELWGRLFRGPNGTRLAGMIEQELTRPGDIIQIWIDQSALDFVFPWPWLYPLTVVAGKQQNTDVRQFWGYRYVVEQLRQLNEEKRPPSTVMGEPLRIAGALHNFATAAAARKFFADYMTKYSERLAWAEVTAAEWRQFLPKSDAHLLYFYCHGHTEQPLDAVGAEMFRTLENLGKTSPAQAAAWVDSLNAEMRRKIRGQSGIAIEREILNLADLAQFQSGDPSLKPVVFLNMCESAEFYPGATDNLVDVFLRRGARGVIGTEVPVLAAFGDAFARGFFEAFFAAGKAGEGNEIGMVLWQLRRKFLDEGNPLAFIYTYFGDATTRLKPAIIESAISVGVGA